MLEFVLEFLFEFLLEAIVYVIGKLFKNKIVRAIMIIIGVVGAGVAIVYIISKVQ